jgi:metal-responsive CopG/Arc/MetJ family transcriptional regulator
MVHMRPSRRSTSKREAKGTRLTISLPATSYREIQLMAKRNKVSAAWIIRQAVDEYIQKDIPLFHPAKP